jgi:hypothetical protein
MTQIGNDHERRSTVISTNLALKQWAPSSPAAACVGALVADSPRTATRSTSTPTPAATNMASSATTPRPRCHRRARPKER